MSWLLKSKRLQSAGQGGTGTGSSSNNNSGSSSSNNINSIYSQGSNNLSTSSISSSTGLGYGSSTNLSSVSLSGAAGLNNTASSSASPAQLFSSHHHIDAGEDMVRQFAASQLDTQKTAFMRWVNVRLATAAAANSTQYMPMTSIEHDLRDGKRLIALLEAVSKEPLKPERGNMRIHQMANVSKALAFLEKRTDEPLGSIGNEDIVNGNVKLTLGLVWIIIYQFQIQQIANTMAEVYPSLSVDDMLEADDSIKGKKRGTSQQVDAKQALLRWVRYQLEDYSDVIPPIQDFHRSWRTGLAFTALIHRLDPDYLSEFYTDILPLAFETMDEWRATLTKAFDVALEKMNLPRLLDPEDLLDVETPDERSIMTYVTEYYVIMSKFQTEQDPAVAAEMRARRLQAKDERLTLAGEDMQARRLRLQEEAERKRREEQEELERIRLKRMEIEGWSIRAAERAKEEEEALRKRREEEAERMLQRKLRREQRERERAAALALKQGSRNGSDPNAVGMDASTGSGKRSSRRRGDDGVGSDYSDSEHEDDHDDDDEQEEEEEEEEEEEKEKEEEEKEEEEENNNDVVNGFSNFEDPEPIDPREQERRQQELEEKLAEYHQGIAELSEWIREQDLAFPTAPDTTSLLDRARDLEPLTDAIKTMEEEQAVKEHLMSHLHDVREELLEYESPDLAPEQVSDMDKRWWELETIWTALTNKVVEGKDTAEEVKWIIDCSQEIDRVNGEISKFEAQLEAFAAKRAQETAQERSQKSVLEQQDVNLSSISFLLETYVDFLTALMDPKVHHYTAPEHLTALNNELTTARLPRLSVVIEKARQNLANDRLLKSFLDSFVLSEAWIGESVEWLRNIEKPVFVTKDHWNGANTVKEYLARDVSQDLNLDYFQAETDELKDELADEQSEVTKFRLSGFAKLDEQAKAVMQSVEETQDITAESTTKTVQDLMQGVMSNLEKVEKLLPKEAEHCAYAARVLDYLWEAQSMLEELEQASTTINKWEMRQPDAEVETTVIQVEEHYETVDTSLKDDKDEPKIREVVQNRHTGLASVVKNLRVCFLEKQEAIKGDRQMKEFLEFTLTCQAALRDFRVRLHDGAPMTGFGLTDNPKPFDDFAALIVSVGESFDKFESAQYAQYLEMGELVKIMAATSGTRQDPAIVQNKLQSVHGLLNDIKALKADREREAATVEECRKLVVSLATLRSDLTALESDLSDLEHLEPHQHQDLMALGERASHLNSQYALLEQDTAFRHLVQDPTCAALLKDITERQSAIQHAQERLQAKLEVKQQWNMAWQSFDERSKALQQYLHDQEQTIRGRGFVVLDCLAEEELAWRRTEDAVRATEVANEETLKSLQDFKASRLTELTALAKSLQQVVDLAGGVDKMDEVRAGQFWASEETQRGLREHLEQLHALNSQEKHQLETLRQRLLWAQHVAEAQAEIDVLATSCQDALRAFTDVLKSCEQSGDTSGLDHTAPENLRQQVQHLISLAAKEKQSRSDAALSTFALLKSLAAKGGDLPSHLESELAAFRNQYDLLDRQLDFAGQLAKHGDQAATYLAKNNALDVELNAVASDLKADREAVRETIEKAEDVRVQVGALAEELHQLVSSSPRPLQEEAGVTQVQLQQQQVYQTLLEALLKKRMDSTLQLSGALDPLLADYEALLRYQDGLRAFAKNLEAHGQWIQESTGKVHQTGNRLQALFSTWPSDSNKSEQLQRQSNEALEKHSSELRSLRVQLDHASDNIQTKEREFEAIKKQITQALLSATSHSKHLQHDLEEALETMEDRIHQLKSEMRHKTHQLDCLDKHAAWDQQLERAREWCQDVDAAVIQFTEKEAQWSGERQAQQQQLDAALEAFEAQLKTFEKQEKPQVDQTWTELCGGLVFAEKSVPEAFERRQGQLGQDCQQLWARIAYGAEVVKQHKSMDAIHERVAELEALRDQVAAIADSDISVQNSAELKDSEAKMRALAQQLEADLLSLHYPSDDSSDAAKARSDQSNASVRRHAQDWRSRVEAAKQTLKDALQNHEMLKRKRLELEAAQRILDQAILDRTEQLKKVASLLEKADAAKQTVSTFVRQETAAKGQQLTSEANAAAVDLQSPPSVNELSSLAQADLEALAARLDTLRKEFAEMTEHKKAMEAEVNSMRTTGAQAEAAATADQNAHFSATRQGTLHDLGKTIVSNRDKLTQLDGDIASTLSQLDGKTLSILESLDQQSATLAAALKERIRMDDEEKAFQLEQERLRIERARAVQQFEQSKAKFLAWSERQLQELEQVWDTCGQFSKVEEKEHEQVASPTSTKSAKPVKTATTTTAKTTKTKAPVTKAPVTKAPVTKAPVTKSLDSVENAVASLEANTLQCHEDLSKQEAALGELKYSLDTLFNGEEHAADRQRHAEAINAAWSAVKVESDGYYEILQQMKLWSDLRGAIALFEKNSLGSLEKRVEALRWMHWDAFLPEEESLLKLVEEAEHQANDLKMRSDMISAIELTPAVQATHKAILDSNRAYFEARLEPIPRRIEAAKTQMQVIHETSKEIALHAKFHADLVRVETAIAQQIDAVKARCGSLERSSCFALNSKALEAVVVAANEVCMDGKYQLSVLQEVEYPSLEQTAFDLDMLTADDPSDPQDSVSSSRTGVQESMQRIRQALKQLAGYVEEDCFEILLAAKFYTHCKATEDIRQWITACRESMSQLGPVENHQDLTEKMRRQQSREWRMRHLETLEKKLNAFGATVQNYDRLLSDFMLIQHPQISMLDLLGRVTPDPQQQQQQQQEEGAQPMSMRVILRQTVQERAKRTREDWELLKQEFLAKTTALDEQCSEDENAMTDANGHGSGYLGRGSMESTPSMKAKTLSRFGTEILEDISRVSREVQEMFDHVASNQSTLSLAVESDGALIKSKDGQARLEMIEAYIRDVLQAKVEQFDAMLSAANEQSEQDQARVDNNGSSISLRNASEQGGVSTRSHMRHQEKMVGVAMQRGLIAESMNRLVDSCNHQRKEVEETVRVQNAMDLLDEASMLCESMAATLTTADSLLTVPPPPSSPSPSASPLDVSAGSTSMYNLPSMSSSSSLASINLRSPLASPSMSPSATVSRATMASRERRASRAAMRRSFSLSSMNEQDIQQWGEDYRTLMGQLDGFTHDIEQKLETVASMADRLHDWRLDENYGIATEHWQKLKKSALAKKQGLDRVWARRPGGEMSQPGSAGHGPLSSSVHPLEAQPFSSRPSVMQPTASSNSRVKAILGSPVETLSPPQPQQQPPYQRKKRMSTGNIMSRGIFVPSSPTPSVPGTTSTSATTTSTTGGNNTATRAKVMGRVRSGTAPGSTTSAHTSLTDLSAKKFAMSPTFSQEAKRRPPVIRKNDSTSSISSLANIPEQLLSPPSRQQQQPRTIYKPDMSNVLDVEVARVVNASGFAMKVQKLKEGQSPYLTTSGGRTRSRSDSTSSLVLSGALSDNGGYEGGMDSTGSSPRAVKTIRGQSRLGVHPSPSATRLTSESGGGNSSDEVGRYVFGDVEPKVCYCRILRSRKVMVRVGGGWSELSKFMEDHASLEQRKMRSKLLSASNSSVSVASQYGRSASVLSNTESRQRNHLSPLDGSSDSLSDGPMSGGDAERGDGKKTTATTETRKPRRKEMIYHIRPSDNLALKSIKFVKGAAGDGLVAI
ncbi:actinin alpha 2 [Dissophora globulifera]|nr:actinin alpha 2 [Dissophora globulifera]